MELHRGSALFLSIFPLCAALSFLCATLWFFLTLLDFGIFPIYTYVEKKELNMAFFRRKEAAVAQEEPPAKKTPQSLPEFVRDRVLTAEGWQRRSLSKAGLTKKPK